MLHRSWPSFVALSFSVLLLLASGLAAMSREPDPRPKTASIVDVPRERRDHGSHIGNVRVRFTDGHVETWTSLGRCLIPHVSRKHLVGWTRFEDRNSYGDVMNSRVRIRFLDGRIKDFVAGHPFIDDWGFCDGDQAIVIQSMSRHGPSYYDKYDVMTGEKIGVVDRSTVYEELPDWAQPFAADRPGR
jgi:hypothetical protein